MNVLTPVAAKVGSISWLPRFLPQITAVDRSVQSVSGGRLSILKIAGLPNLMLGHVGRKSGRLMRTPLLCVPWRDGYLIAGSNFGAEKAPVWILNLRAMIERGDLVNISVQHEAFATVPRELSGEERETAWAHMVQTWPNFDLYRQRTNRTIPVFFLQRAG